MLLSWIWFPLTQTAHHPWTTFPIMHCTHTFPSTITPITQLSPFTHQLWLPHHTCTSFSHSHKSSTQTLTQCEVLFSPGYISERSPISVRNGQRRVDPLAAIFNGQNQTGKVSRQKQEYQRQGRDVNNTRQKSGSQAQVQRSKVRQSEVKHRDSRMNRRTLRNVTRGKQDFALGECLCAAFMWVREWGAGVVRQSELMSEWWQLCDWCNGGRECVSAVHDGKCSPRVMCSLSEWEPDSWQL